MKSVTEKIIKKSLSIMMCLVLLLGFSGNVKAAGTGRVSSNIYRHNYLFSGAVNGDYANPVTSYLMKDKDGNINRVEAFDDAVVLETYQKTNFALLDSVSISKELPLFGGFYAGQKYNYIVFGQHNPDENDAQEVIRIVQYDKNWRRVASDSIYGGNTTTTFGGGSLRMCEAGNMLYIRTCHEMYKTDDGCNHQANITICYNTGTGKITDKHVVISSKETGYVSHSFNQFIIKDEDNLIFVDHGDGYPRALFLAKCSGMLGKQILNPISNSVELITFPGDVGMNYTGASLGGLEASSTHYLIAYNSVEQQFFYGSVRNIFVAAVNKNSITQSAIQTRQLTQYSVSGGQSASNPILLKVSPDEFLLMWEIYNAGEVDNVGGKPGTNTIQYVKLDGSGSPIGEIHTEKGKLSDCYPIISDGKAIWYVTSNSAPEFYQLDLNTEKLSIISGDNGSKIENENKQATKPSVSVGLNTGTSTKVTGKKPAQVSKVSVKAYKKSIHVKWKRQTAVNGGYQIQYAANKKFTKAKRTKNVSKGNSKKIIKNLKKNKTYYIRVRAYNYNGKKKIYGKWSKVKKVRTKK